MSGLQTPDVDAYAARTGIEVRDVMRMAVEEGFLRRAAVVKGPFALKGSYVTRQHLQEGWRRIPGDLDWVGLGELDAEVLTQWVTAITETQLDDGIRFRSFSENAFWRQIDYAMTDDFPTVNTDLLAWVGDDSHEISSMDVSFGLRLEPSPQPLEYRPLFGDAFILPACALELQIAWKLHQCLVRPRFKDIFDIGLLLRDNPGIDPATIWHVLEDECARDATPLGRFNWLLDATVDQHPEWKSRPYERHTLEDGYSMWRNSRTYGEALEQIYRDGAFVPPTLDRFLGEFAARLAASGFTRTSRPDAIASPSSKPAVSRGAVTQPTRPWWKLW